jgi:hypothetical protein
MWYSLCWYFVTLCDFELSDLDLQFVNKIGADRIHVNNLERGFVELLADPTT